MILLSRLIACTPDQVDSGAPGDTSAPLPPLDVPTIFTIVLENQDYVDIVGSENAPYINSLIAEYGLATSYRETGEPSLPNYRHMISGDNQYPGGLDVLPDTAPFFPSLAENLGT